MRTTIALSLTALLVAGSGCEERPAGRRVAPAAGPPAADRPLGPSPAALTAGGARGGTATGGDRAGPAAPDAAGAVAADPPFAPAGAADLLRLDRPGRRAGRYGGELRLVSPAAPATFNPLLIQDVHTAAMLERTVWSTLVDYDRESFQIEPSLATVWERSEDGRTWTFDLRPGVRWSDGAALTTEDVLFSFRAAMDEKVGAGAADLLRDAGGDLPEVAAADGGKVVFRLKGDHAVFLPAVAGVHILPAARWEAAWKAGTLPLALGVGTQPDALACTGPFRIKSYEPGKALVLERNPHSFLADVKGMRLPYLDRLVWRIAADYDEAMRLFEAGDVDAYDQLRPADFERLAEGGAAGGITALDLGPSRRTTFLALNLRPGEGQGVPWALGDSGRTFRRALAHAIDRKGLVEKVLGGRGRPQLTMVGEADHEWAHPTASQAVPAYSPEEARKLLGSIGLRPRGGDGVLRDGQGRRVELEIATNAEDALRVATAAAVAADLRRVGMGAEVRPVPFPALVARLTARDGAAPWQAVLLGFGGNVPPDAALWGSVYRSSGSLHVWSPRQARPATAWEARIDALAASLSGAADFLVRKKAHDEILDILADQQPLIHLYTPDLFVAARAAVANFRPSPLRPHATWNAEELFLDPGAAATAAR